MGHVVKKLEMLRKTVPLPFGGCFIEYLSLACQYSGCNLLSSILCKHNRGSITSSPSRQSGL